ncbi:Putative Flp pilus-assembly TadE/G-like [Bryocella elongata]|uniref:Putative Flp pilus-assembly TadE/G-like n=1 Tax=Bryocella elongata TaxID=863522 RepID=A0A1H6A1C5_9BACT|nr:pilus assembly protein TadG-related protein [Bryocella elongata]SEG42563.1 Putative Flp pilus-assembly TadE/G-like [Bryocella elongata]
MSVRRFLRDQTGQALIISAIALSMVVGFLGMAVDVGHLWQVKRQLQTAADSAALAAAMEIRTCGSLPNCQAMQDAASSAITENGYSTPTVYTNCTNVTSTGLSLTINDPVCAMGASDPNYGSTRAVEAVVTTYTPTYFARIFGFGNFKVGARAEAARTSAGCVYALDPSGDNAVTIDIALMAACSIIDESASPYALTCLLSFTVTAPRIRVTGGDAGLLCGIVPHPQLNAARPTPNDPLAYLTPPSTTTCGTSTRSPYFGSSSMLTLTALNGPVVLNPGTYCGGINIAVLANVTFNPGTYVIESNNTGLLGLPAGGLSISLLSTVSGSGVTFYNYGPVGGITFLAPSVLGLLGSVNLTAPTTGSYPGILFWQDASNTTPATILASGPWGSKLEGAFYFPSASVNYAVDGVANYNILVAKDIVFLATIGSVFNANYNSLPGGSPLSDDSAVLVQ